MSTIGQIIRCKAAVAWGIGQPLSIETIEVAPPKSHEVRIKIVAASVCHTDASVLNGVTHKSLGVFPIILGHEGSGIVESVGDGVVNVKPGDHVIPLFIAQCEECKLCKNTKHNFCEKSTSTKDKNPGTMSDGTTRFTCRGKSVYHFLRCSTFSEYTVVNDIAIAKINERAPLEKVCLFGCCIPTGYGAVMNTAKVEKGSTVAVWGLGGIGLAVVMGANEVGASRIIAIDTNSKKFEAAKIFGATDFINPNDQTKPIQQILIEMTEGGLDYTFECCGHVTTMQAALESCRLGGVCTILGVAPSGQEISINPFLFVGGRTLKGSGFGGYKNRDSLSKLVEKYLDGQLKVDEFITHTFKIEDINEAFDVLLKGKSIRSVIYF